MKHGFKVILEHYSSKEHWYIKYLFWCIIGIICFAILIQILKEFGIPPAQQIFDFFSQWAIVLSAGATFLLALTAFWAIIDNRYGRILDRKERQLTEIIEWAIDLGKCSFEHEFQPVTDISAEYFLRVSRVNTLARLNTVRARKKYVTDIAAAFKQEQALQSAVEEVKQELENTITVIGKQVENKPTLETISDAETKLYKSIETLIEEAAKIKTRVLS